MGMMYLDATISRHMRVYCLTVERNLLGSFR